MSQESQSPLEGWLPLGTNVHLPVRVAAPFNTIRADRLTTRLHHGLVGSPRTVRLMFSNWVNDGGHDRPGPNPVTISVTLGTAGGGRRSLSFEGHRAVCLQPGAAAISDPVDLGAPASVLTSTTSVVPSGGTQVPLGPGVDTAAGEYVHRRPSDGIPGPPPGHGYGPAQILGIPTDGAGLAPCVLLIGDSNAVGFGDRRGTAEHLGWARRLLDGRGPVVNASTSGATAQGALSGEAADRRSQLLTSFTGGRVVVALGTNDLQRGGPLAPVQAALSRHWDHWARAGWRVIAVTIPPVTDSDDGWVSLFGQTPAPGHRERMALNDWIRSCPPPVEEVWDLAAPVETERRLWRPGMTRDGVHLSPLGHASAAAHLAAHLD